MICYVVIDTNVLVSALLSSHEDAATVQVLKIMLTGDIKHFPERPYIVTARQFLEILQANI